MTDPLDVLAQQHGGLTVAAAPAIPGLLTPGTIDLMTRPRVANPDGSVSTVRSMSFNDDGKEILIPTVVNGKVVSDDEAIKAFRETGQHLGVFDTPAHATSYAQQLHADQAKSIGTAGDPLDALAHAHGAIEPDFRSTNVKDAAGNAVAWNEPGGDVILDNLRDVGGIAKDLIVGGAKALARSGIRGGELLRKIPGVDALANALPSAQVPVEPTNLTQMIGGGVEQAAEVAAPARAVSALGVKAAEVAAPYLSRVLSPMLAKLIPQVVVEAAGNAGLSKAQGGSNAAAGVTAALSVVPPTAGAIAAKLADTLRAGATGHVEKFFSPTTKPLKAVVAKRTPEILERGSEVLGTLGRNRQGAADVFDAHRQQAVEAIDEALKAFGDETVRDAPQRIMAALDTAKAPFVKTRIVSAADAAGPMKPFVVGTLEGGRAQVAIPLNAGKVKQIDSLKQIVQAHGDDMSIDDLVGLRRAWDEIAYAKPGMGELGPSQSAKWAKKMGGDAIRAIVQSDRPDLAALNREFAFWKDLDTVMDATNLRKVGQVGLLPHLAEGAGVAGTLASGSIGQAILVGKAAKLAQQVFASPRYNAIAAEVKTALANALASGNHAATDSWLRTAAGRLGIIEGPRVATEASR